MTPRALFRAVLLGVLALYAVGLLIYFVYSVREVLLLLFVAWLVATALEKPVEYLSRRLPRILAILICYLAMIGLVAGLLALMVPPLVAQTRALADNFPSYLEQAEGYLGNWQQWFHDHGIDVNWREQAQQLGRYADDATLTLFRLPFAAFRVALSTLAVLALALYWLLERDAAVNWIVELFWPNRRERATALIHQAELQMGAYVRGLALLAVAVGGTTFVGLMVLGVPYALPLAVIAGILELLPTIGPIISAVPAVIVAATQSPALAGLVALLYLLVQQLENYVLVPRVHQAAVGLNPLAVLVSVLLGSAFAGIAGAILAVPVAALVALVVRDIQAARAGKLNEHVGTTDPGGQAAGSNPKHGSEHASAAESTADWRTLGK